MAESALSKAGKTAQNNPATATGSIGVVVTIVGRFLGWDPQTSLDVATLFLIAVPSVRALVFWWEHRHEET